MNSEINLLSRGKTKRVYAAPDGRIFMVTDDILSIGNGAQIFRAPVAKEKIKQTSAIFDFLSRLGIPTSNVQLALNKTPGIFCDKCRMIPIEFVCRLRPFGSFLFRHPEFCNGKDAQGIPRLKKSFITEGMPSEFVTPVCEMFLKDTVCYKNGISYLCPENTARELYCRDGIWKDAFPDPYIEIINEKRWVLHDSKHPIVHSHRLMEIPQYLTTQEIKMIQKYMIMIALALNTALSEMDYHLIDFKIEFGYNQRGEIVLADVLDNDCWKLFCTKKQLPERVDKNIEAGFAEQLVIERYKQITKVTSQLYKYLDAADKAIKTAHNLVYFPIGKNLTFNRLAKYVELLS